MKRDLNDATQFTDDSQLLVGRVRHRPIYDTKPTGRPAGATNSNSAIHPSHDSHVSLDRARRRPSTLTKPKVTSAGVTNSNIEKRRPKTISKSISITVGAGGEEDRRFVDPLVVTIVAKWRQRQVWHRAEKSLTLQCSAICRSWIGVQGKGDKKRLKKAATLLEKIEAGTDTSEAAITVMPFLMARAQIRPHRERTEKMLAKMALQLPIASVIKKTKGLGPLGLVAIVGEAARPLGISLRTSRVEASRSGCHRWRTPGPPQRQRRSRDARLFAPETQCDVERWFQLSWCHGQRSKTEGRRRHQQAQRSFAVAEDFHRADALRSDTRPGPRSTCDGER